MDRRRGINSRPATSEEVEYWTQAAEAIRVVTNKYPINSTTETIGRVNRLISAWPTDDTLPAEGIDAVKQTFKRLTNGLRDVETSALQEEKALDDAIERVEILIALRKAPEVLPPEKRNKRPRPPSPGTPAASVLNPVKNSVSITLPARGSVGPSGATPRDAKARKDGRTDKFPLQEGRKVAFHPPPNKGASGDTDENTWILALVTKCITSAKYEVQDAEPQEDGQPGVTYVTNIKSIIPLPDPNAAPGSSAHVSSYQGFPAGSTVMALYPDTSCFYRAEVIATPKEMHPTGRVMPSPKHMPTYKLKFEDDDNQEHAVAAQWVVEWPGN